MSDDDNNNVPYGRILKIVGGSTIMFYVVHVYTYKYFRRNINRTIWNVLSKSERLAFPEKICSCIHAIVTGSIALYLVVIQRAFAEHTVLVYPKECDWLFGVMVAYQVYDLFVMMIQNTDTMSMFVHHVCSLLGALTIMILRRGTFAPVMFAISELTVPFVNIGWYCRKLQLDRRHWLTRTSDAFTFPSYMIFRLFQGPLTVGWLAYLQQFHHYVQHCPWWATLLSAVNVSLLSYLNVRWTRGLYRKYARGVPLN